MANERLSVVIPARNEQFLQRTVECVLAAAEGDIEVVAVCDGYWPKPSVKDDPRVVLLHFTEPIGQRAAINRGCRVATGKYMMKLDAHCNVAKGFDTVLKRDCKPEWTMVPRMYNLDITTFQPKRNKRTDYMYISGPKHAKPFRAFYYGSYEGVNAPKPQSNLEIDETMCCMGPGWFMHMDRFWELGGCDEAHGGWGQQGVEVALKAWLSGGALMVNKRTWFAHWFRGGGVPEGFQSGFPYPIRGRDVARARKHSTDLWLGNKWPKATRTIEWLVDKFKPPTWELAEQAGQAKQAKQAAPAPVPVPSAPSSSQVAPAPQPQPTPRLDPSPALSVIIPSYKDPYLHKTILSILENFDGDDYEIVPVLDGYEPAEPLPDDPRVRPLRLPSNQGMRLAINQGVRASRGHILMRSDEHCMFCKHFNSIMLASLKRDEIATARRFFLDPEKWQVMQEHGYIDYEKLLIKTDPRYTKFAAVKWISRTRERANQLYDEDMAWQGSLWLMHRDWWVSVIGGLQVEGYGTHYQDTTEMLFKTWQAGGRLMLNKMAWFAHKHRSFKRTHHYSLERAIPEWQYALDTWMPEYEKAKARWGMQT